MQADAEEIGTEGREAPYPKIELHVHLEGTVRPATLLEIARRNDFALPADTVEGLAELYRFRDFAHFIEVWVMTTAALQTAEDYRQIVVDYAAEAAAHGAVYIEGIFSPARPVLEGSSREEVFEGYCDGAQEARELHGVEVRLTPDIPRGFALEAAEKTAGMSIAYRDRGVLGPRARRAGGRVPAGALRARLRPRPRRRARLGPPRRRGRGRRVDPRRLGDARRRPHPPRHPRSRRPGAGP
jgi:adenosine deaminase